MRNAARRAALASSRAARRVPLELGEKFIVRTHCHFLIPALALLVGLVGCQAPQNQPTPRAETDQSQHGPFPDEQSGQFPTDESTPPPGQTPPPGGAESPTQSPMGPGP